MNKDTVVATEPQELPLEPDTPLGDDDDVEKGAAEGRLELSRTMSEAPYSIFTPRMKLFIVGAVSISSLISPFGATTFYPALDVIADALGVTPTLINFSLTTYMIAQAIAPALIAGMSDNNGRRLSYIICFIIFTLANVGLALQTSYAALLVLRMVQAFGCSAAIALSNAVVADIATSAERGKYMGYATAGLLFGPAFGPTIGGLFAEYLGWRWTFWFLVIFTGVLLIVFTLVFPETCRTVVGNGSIPAKGINESLLGRLARRRQAKENGGEINNDAHSVTSAKKGKVSLPNPLLVLKILADKESLVILIYNGLFFTGMMVVTGSLPTLYQEAYGLNTLQTGLCYIAQGMGSLLSSLTMGHAVDWNFRRHARKLNLPVNKGKQQDLTNFPIERVRFEVVLPAHIIGTFAFLVFGWTLNFRTSLAGPEIALFFIGFGVSTAFSITNTLLMDLHKGQPATASSAVNFVRCLMSAGGAAAILPMCRAMGIGWAYTFIAMLFFILILAVLLLMSKGMKWRQEAAEKKRRNEEVAAREVVRDVERDSIGSSGGEKEKEDDTKA